MKRLFILGNGFDLAHNLPTSYEDYRIWLQLNYSDFLELLEEIYCNSSGVEFQTLWSDFEKSLGEYDIEEVYRYFSAEIDFDEDHMFRTSANIEDFFEEIGSSITDNFQVTFKEWISSVEESQFQTPKKFCFKESDNFITFNYTKTLERIYGISSERVLHIHGIFNSNQDIDIGFKENNSHKYEVDTEGYIYEENAKSQFNSALRQLIKDTKSILEREKKKILTLLNAVYEIQIIGFSYSEIDFDYIKFIRDNLSSDANWIFYFHNNKDLAAAQDYAKRLCLTPIYKRI